MKKTIRGAVCLLLALLTLLLCASCSKPEDDRTVLTVNGEKICYDEYRYFFLNSAASLREKGITDFSVEENLEALRADTLEILKRNAAIRSLSEEYKFTLDKEDKKLIKDQYNAVRDEYEDEESFLQSLRGSYLTDYEFRRVQETVYLWQKLYDCMTDESNFIIRADNETLLADIPVNFWHGIQILVMNDAGEKKEDNRALAEKILAELDGGADFSALLAEYGQDPGSKNGIGYYFTAGELLEYFEEAIRGMEEGEWSGVIETPDGYAIVKRLPMEQEYINKHLEDFRERYMARRFNEMLADEMKKVVYETTTLYYSLDPDDM